MVLFPPQLVKNFTPKMEPIWYILALLNFTAVLGFKTINMVLLELPSWLGDMGEGVLHEK